MKYSIRRAELSQSGLPRVGSGLGGEDFSGPSPDKAGKAKHLYTKLERLIFSCRMTWAWSVTNRLYDRLLMIRQER